MTEQEIKEYVDREVIIQIKEHPSEPPYQANRDSENVSVCGNHFMGTTNTSNYWLTKWKPILTELVRKAIQEDRVRGLPDLPLSGEELGELRRAYFFENRPGEDILDAVLDARKMLDHIDAMERYVRVCRESEEGEAYIKGYKDAKTEQSADSFNLKTFFEDRY